MQRGDHLCPQKPSDRPCSTPTNRGQLIMTQTQTVQPKQSNPAPRIPLTPDEEWALVADVQARTQLLKRKKEGLTLAEKRICIKGERALRLLVQDCHRLIWWHIHHFHTSNRIPMDEMYQLGVMVVESAANNHNPNKSGRQRTFTNWFSLQLKQHFIKLSKKESGYHRRCKSACDQLIHSDCVSDGYTPLKSACDQGLREKLEQIINKSLPEHEAKMIHDYYLRDKQSKYIAASLGVSSKTVMVHIGQSREQLRENPQLRELAESVFSTTPNY